ncbi:MAG TPA: hypothetical protein VI670_10925 [Thermoanaerobaculia bacterium]|jgi:hypothetical protein
MKNDDPAGRGRVFLRIGIGAASWIGSGGLGGQRAVRAGVDAGCREAENERRMLPILSPPAPADRQPSAADVRFDVAIDATIRAAREVNGFDGSLKAPTR